MSDESAPKTDNEQTWRARLGAAADDVEAKEEAAKLAHEQRDELIVQAVEAGHHLTDVARWARISPARVSSILGQH